MFITRAKGGTAEHRVRVEEIQIPDLGNFALSLPEPWQSQVQELWHLCHDLHNHLLGESGISGELLEALERLIHAFEADARISPQMPMIISLETNGEALRVARAAIAKATQ